MDFSKYSGMELIRIYGELLSKMREDELIRSKNVTGDLGEYIVIDYYTKTKGLPKLQFAPPSTKNIDAISVNGERYSIKCTTTNTTGAFYGINKDADIASIKPLFKSADSPPFKIMLGKRFRLNSGSIALLICLTFKKEPSNSAQMIPQATTAPFQLQDSRRTADNGKNTLLL